MLGEGVPPVSQHQEGGGCPFTLQSSLAFRAAGLPVCELATWAPVLPSPGSAWPSNEGEKMQKHSTEPAAQANVKRRHEKLKFMGLKEKQHLGRNYCNLKGGCGPVYKSQIWRQCLTFFLKLVCIPVMKPWCELPDV